jgi:serine phosphatase RsbU (regulator of sigma subunit)
VRRRRARAAAIYVVYVVAFVALDLVSRGIERLNGVAAFFPADGLALAFLYIEGFFAVPAVLLGYLISPMIVYGMIDLPTCAGSTMGTLLQTLGMVLLRNVFRTDLARGRIVDVGRFLVTVAILASVGAVIIRWAVITSGAIPASQGNVLLFTSFAGLATGLLMIASPAAIVAHRVREWLRGGSHRLLLPGRGELRQVAVDGVVLLVATWLAVVVAFSPRTREFEPLYLCFAPIIWLSLRHGLAGAAIAILVVDAAVVLAFRIQNRPAPELDKIQVLELALSLTGLILGSVVTERETAQAQAREGAVLRHELAIAREVQMGLLPKHARLPGFEVAATMRPASQVGGDFFDILTSGEDPRFWLLIGDASGHGLEAGLVILMAQAAAQATVRARPTMRPREVVGDVNRVVYENLRQRMNRDDYLTFMTMCHEGDGRFVMAGGHLPAFVARRDGTVSMIDPAGPWCGILPDLEMHLEEKELVLHPGDVFCLVTDGILEARAAHGEMFGEDRLLSALRDVVGLPANEALARLLSRVAAFAPVQEDDMTIVLVSRPERTRSATGSRVPS